MFWKSPLDVSCLKSINSVRRLDAARVTLLEGINKLNKLILTMSRKFTLAVSSLFCFVPSSGITHSHFCEGLHMHLPYWWEWQTIILSWPLTVLVLVPDESLLARCRWVTTTRVSSSSSNTYQPACLLYIRFHSDDNISEIWALVIEVKVKRFEVRSRWIILISIGWKR